MSFEMKKIKVKDKQLAGLFKRTRASQMGMQVMAEANLAYSSEAWKMAYKMYNLDPEKNFYQYNDKEETIEWKEFKEQKKELEKKVVT